MKDEHGIDDTNLLDDIGIANDISEVMPFLMEQASKVGTIVELGVQYGNGSTKALTWGLRKSSAENKLMVSVDLEKNFTDYRIPTDSWWHFIQGSSIDSSTLLSVGTLLNGQKIGLIFFDTDHNPDQIIAELNAWIPYCDENTIYIFHDTAALEMFPGYTDAIIKWANDNNLLYTIVSSNGQGLSIVTKK